MARLTLNLAASAVVVLITITYAAPAAVEARRKPPKGPEHFTFYLHNTVYNPAVNNSAFDSVYSAGPANFSQPNPNFFGVRSTFEDPITSGPLRNSTQIGIGQGISVYTGQKEFILFQTFTATIESGPHKGTISIFGQIKEVLPGRIMTVIGGTGDFLAGRGAAVCKLVTIDHTPPASWTLSFDLDLYY